MNMHDLPTCETKTDKKIFEIKREIVCKKLRILHDNAFRDLLKHLRNCVGEDM
jgi:hypothetical protein